MEHSRLPIEVCELVIDFCVVTALHLRSPRFSTFNQFARFILSFSSLSHLTIRNLAWNVRGRHSHTIHQRKRVESFTLKSLSLRQFDHPLSADVFTDVTKFMMATSIKTTCEVLDLRLPGDAKGAAKAEEAAGQLVASCGSVLKELAVEYSHIVSSTASINLDQNTHLRRLTLNSNLLATHLQYLNTLCSKVITTITLRTPYQLGFTGNPSIKPLEAALSRSVFDTLQQVALDIHTGDIKQLPKLHARGILVASLGTKSSAPTAAHNNTGATDTAASDGNNSEDSEDYDLLLDAE
ncbi:hypothetical protein EIP91_010585 [Steccherinum ochraceum]|uniref:Uncharacterized protein n=1 Tax=Steccherinum ochraceum TaxID=92696 RepID=A0A4R0RSP8_9APHY|nr:hypothetical protein EIP91_010585 [Steccherinum ochraceum]